MKLIYIYICHTRDAPENYIDYVEGFDVNIEEEDIWRLGKSSTVNCLIKMVIKYLCSLLTL